MSFSMISIADSPIAPRSRWGHGLPTNPQIHEIISRSRSSYSDTITKFVEFRPLLHTITRKQTDEILPFWDQLWFSTLDAAALVAFLGLRRPKRYIEIGSGNSTKFARFAIKSLGLQTTLTSIDPEPRASVNALCDVVIRSTLQDCKLSVFDELKAGDMLFFDGSHRIFTNSDVSVFFLELLPRLPDGVLVHVHDVFLPDDYPHEWIHQFYSEQYVLAALLMGGVPPIKIILPNYFVASDSGLSVQLRTLFAPFDSSAGIPPHYENNGNTPPVSFWFESAFEHARNHFIRKPFWQRVMARAMK